MPDDVEHTEHDTGQAEQGQQGEQVAHRDPRERVGRGNPATRMKLDPSAPGK
jgi:hypothetical protein